MSNFFTPEEKKLFIGSVISLIVLFILQASLLAIAGKKALSVSNETDVEKAQREHEEMIYKIIGSICSFAFWVSFITFIVVMVKKRRLYEKNQLILTTQQQYTPGQYSR